MIYKSICLGILSLLLLCLGACGGSSATAPEVTCTLVLLPNLVVTVKDTDGAVATAEILEFSRPVRQLFSSSSEILYLGCGNLPEGALIGGTPSLVVESCQGIALIADLTEPLTITTILTRTPSATVTSFPDELQDECGTIPQTATLIQGDPNLQACSPSSSTVYCPNNPVFQFPFPLGCNTLLEIDSSSPTFLGTTFCAQSDPDLSRPPCNRCPTLRIPG